MQSINIPLTEIKVGDRMRKDLGTDSELDTLAESIKTLGLLQLPLVDQDFNLIDGGRRLHALTALGWKTVDVIVHGAVTEMQLRIMELEANIRRKDMNWKEQVMSVAEVHRLHAQSAALEGDTWSQKQTGRLLGGMSVGAVNYCVEVARHLRKTDHPVHKAESLMEALRILCQIKEDEINKYESSFAKEVMTTSAKAVAAGASLTIDSLIKQNDQKVEITPSLSTDGKKPPMVIQLSNYFTHANCIEHMTSMGSEAVDHIITDAPYGIDMDMLNQQNPHGSMVDIDRVEDEHDVQANVKLFHEMYPRMFDVLKDKGFCVVWIDQMHWQLHYDLATKCGFKVQRWPLTWVKTHQCMNQSAQYNFTKATEVAIVCRKGNATIVRPQSTNVWIGTNDEARKSFGHPFAKPEGLWRWIFEAVAVKGQTIYDPFSGVGTCPLAAARAGYFPRGCELKDIHYNRLIVGFKELMGNWYSKTHDLSFQ